ncbi:TIGR03086 family metal-binding protein [Streptomyces sp. NPDC060035]|uniref:TIGR03086 family metal-binding protein n=1 Tax=Streptomyces sp. NPDC060035 TaxID=3347044 RepID=UPI0036B1E605
MENVHPHLIECSAEAAVVARGVGAQQLTGTTPCGAWDVRSLANHLVAYTSHGFEYRARREPFPDELAARDFTAEPDWAADYAVQLDSAVAAWAEPAVWEGEVDLGFAGMPARAMAAVTLMELAVHGWDLATATGQQFRMSDAAARLVLDTVENHVVVYRLHDAFGDAVVPDAGANIFHRALMLSGRDPNWAA